MPTFANTIDNNEILAKRSQCDYAGNDIQTTYATKSEVTTGLASKQDTISDLATIRSGAADGATAVQPSDLATVATTGAYSDLTGTPTIPSGAQLVPAATSADADKVLTVDAQGIPGWAVVPSQSTGLFEAVYGQTSYSDIVQAIADKKIVYCRISATGASRMAFLAYIGTTNVEFQYYRSLSSHSASNMTDEVYVYTVDSSGWTTTTRKTGVKVTAGTHMSQSYSNDTLTLNATWPTVDQTYDGTSTNAQSGTAVAGAIATKEDAFDVGTGLEMDTSGSTPTLQVEAPVDIVAGPGIVIDNPDGNTLRVSVAQDVEVVLYSNNGASQLPQSTVTLSENASNFEKVVVMYRDRFNNITNSTTFYTDNLTFGGEPTSRIFLSAPFLYESANPIMARCSQYKFTAGNILTFESCGNMLYTTTGVTCSYFTAANNQGTFIYKVVGVHRIAGGN